jgi:omega-amidase
MDSLKVAIIQIQTGPNKKSNLLKTAELFTSIKNHQANLILLPEMFQCPYSLESFPTFAEDILTGETSLFLSNLAHEHRVFLVGGSIPEKKGNHYYNTSIVYNPSGEIVGVYRKIHLFDVDFKNLHFQESAVLDPGNTPLLIDTPWGKIGILICYDLRFPELIRLYALRGAFMVAVPAAFNPVTGPLHWEVLFRARAIDNQVFLLGASPAPHPGASYQAYGHSLIVDPMGRVLEQLGDEEAIIIKDLDLSLVNQTRQRLPLLKHRRQDLYALNPDEKLDNSLKDQKGKVI